MQTFTGLVPGQAYMRNCLVMHLSRLLVEMLMTVGLRPMRCPCFFDYYSLSKSVCLIHYKGYHKNQREEKKTQRARPSAKLSCRRAGAISSLVLPVDLLRGAGEGKRKGSRFRSSEGGRETLPAPFSPHTLGRVPGLRESRWSLWLCGGPSRPSQWRGTDTAPG